MRWMPPSLSEAVYRGGKPARPDLRSGKAYTFQKRGFGFIAPVIHPSQSTHASLPSSEISMQVSVKPDAWGTARASRGHCPELGAWTGTLTGPRASAIICPPSTVSPLRPRVGLGRLCCVTGRTSPAGHITVATTRGSTCSLRRMDTTVNIKYLSHAAACSALRSVAIRFSRVCPPAEASTSADATFSGDHVDAVDRTRFNAKITASALINDHCVHELRCTENGIHRTRLLHLVQPMHSSSRMYATVGRLRHRVPRPAAPVQRRVNWPALESCLHRRGHLLIESPSAIASA